MAEAQPGRVRGRARGRSRGQQPGAEPVRKPGEVPATQARSEPGVGAPAAPSRPSAPSGRATRRGGLDRAAGESENVGALAKQLQQIEPFREGGREGHVVAGRGVSRGGRQWTDDDRVTSRPAHLIDKTGSSGNMCELMANYFKVESTPGWAVYQYHINFNPDIESLGMRKAMMGDHRALFTRPYLFDGMALWSPAKLEQEEMEVVSQRRSDGANIRILIKFIRELDPNDPVVLQIMNIQMRKNFTHMKFQLLGRNFFDPMNSAAIPQHGLELWPGFTTSIRQHEASVLMCTDLMFKILRVDTAIDLLWKVYNSDRTNFKDTFSKQILGSIVLTRYNNRTYRIDDLNWSLNPTSTFQMKDGTEINYIDYYKKTWQITIKDRTQPLLVSAPKKKDIRRGMNTPYFLIPELCTITGLNEETRSDYHVMGDIAKHTRVDPSKRVDSLMKFLARIKENKEIQTEMENWGLRYANNLVHFRGRTLNPETIIQCGNKMSYNRLDAEWSREMRGKKLQSCVHLENWMVVVTRRDEPKANDFIQNLSRVCPPMGINVRSPHIEVLPDDRTNSFIRAIRENLNSRIQLIVAIFPNNRKDRYDAVKKLCCLDYPVASQVIVARTLTKKHMLMSVATKIAIQLNCKLGGEVWVTDIPLRDLMVVGYDSYHDSSQKGRSVGGIVCSTNATLTKYHSRVTFQEKHQEMLDGFCISLTNGLKRYHELNGKLPDRLIIYRDGVGDGQLQAVKEWELKQIEQCFSSLGPDYKPKWTFIVVTKRLNTRFFSKREGQIGNPPPGTVVDTEVTKPERYDFFLVSQSVKQGTVSPTGYNVLHDSSLLKPDHIQRLTYKLTHLYYNWPGTIRVPAPCQYAHKLAFLTGQSLHNVPHEELADTLYYL